MGDKATLRLARQELEDLYVGVPDDSVDLTFRDFAFKPTAPAVVGSFGKSTPAVAGSLGKSSPAAATTTSSINHLTNNGVATIAHHISVDDDADGERNKKQTTAVALARSSTNIFTYRPLEDHEDVTAATGGGCGGGGLGGAGGAGGLLQLPPIPGSPLTVHLANSDCDDDDDYADHQYHYPEAGEGTTTSSKSAVAGDHHAAGGRRSRRTHVADDATGGRERHAAARRNNSYRRPGIPHSNICALCNNYIYIFRHRCLVCGRVYCRRCVGDGMGDMTEGRKCIDCLGRRYSHRYIHLAGDTGRCGLCFWGNAKAVAAQELVWAEKGPAPHRRPRPKGSSSISASYGGDGGYYSSTNTVASASMSMTMNSDSSIAMMRMNGGHGRNNVPTSASSSFVAPFPHNPHALPL